MLVGAPESGATGIAGAGAAVSPSSATADVRNTFRIVHLSNQRSFDYRVLLDASLINDEPLCGLTAIEEFERLKGRDKPAPTGRMTKGIPSAEVATTLGKAKLLGLMLDGRRMALRAISRFRIASWREGGWIDMGNSYHVPVMPQDDPAKAEAMLVEWGM